MIKLTILGNIGNDAEVKEVNNKKVITFNVCHTDKWKDQQGNQQSRSTWVQCDYWTDRTTIVQYLKKGTLVYVEGEPTANGYAKKTGEIEGILRCRVSSIQLLSSSKKDEKDDTPF